VTGPTQPRRIAFRRIADAALGQAGAIVQRWLPDGRREGAEWVCPNPMRDDRRRGSFKVNIVTGKWGDFATGDRGGDLIALGAYLFKISQADAAKRIADMLGIDANDG
jgi:hypothetical protein